MGRQKKPPLDERKLQGMKYFKLLDDLLRGLRNAGTDRDRAGNRELFYDQYATLLISFFFNPTIDSLRGLREFTTLEKVQKRWGIKPTSLGSLSEAARVFDPALMESIIAELAQRAGHQHARRGTGGFPSATEAQLAGLIAIDGNGFTRKHHQMLVYPLILRATKSPADDFDLRGRIPSSMQQRLPHKDNFLVYIDPIDILCYMFYCIHCFFSQCRFYVFIRIQSPNPLGLNITIFQCPIELTCLIFEPMLIDNRP